VEKVEDAARQHLLGKDPPDLGCQRFDGFAQNIPDVLAELNTFAMLAATKVVIFKDAKIFDAPGNQPRLIAQIEEAWENQQIAQAAKSLLSLCQRLNLDIAAIAGQSDPPPELDALFQSLGKGAIQQLVAYSMDQGWSAGAADNHVETLQQAIGKGFPQGHYLMITSNSKVPKNLKLYKAVEARGIVVDCSVPQGERRLDKEAQQTVLRQTMETLLQKADKRAAPNLLGELVALTGFDLRIFNQNIEKLVDYVGPREEITVADVQALLRRTKEDPLFQLTNAVADRDVKHALFYTHSLLASGWHPLQLLAALANQIRRLLVAKDFAGSKFGQGWKAGLAYGPFQQQVLPAIQAYDEQVQSQMMPWPTTHASAKSKAGKDGSADLRLAPNPKNPFPIYQTLLKSDKFSLQELVAAMGRLNEADLRLKSTGQDPGILMKKLVVDICRRD
jgi:DNA polymerase-3 subunit delta